MREVIGAGTRISAVIKANAYGHGIESFVPMAASEGVEHFATFSASEALRAWRVLDGDGGVMIMGAVDDDELAWAIEAGVEFFVFDFHRLYAALRLAASIGRPARLHLELETGLNRTGFRAEELERVAGVLRAAEGSYVIEGVNTHYAGAENWSNRDRVRAQIDRYRHGLSMLAAREIVPLHRHTACSAAALAYPETIMDMVRIGIALYGFWPSPEIRRYRISELEQREDPLRQLLSWRSRVMAINEVPEGEHIAYGSSFRTHRRTRLAIVPVGYGYGYTRALSNRGRMLLRGSAAPVIGLVNMNLTLLDVTDIAGVEIGDEVMLIGTQGDTTIRVASFSESDEMLNTEMMVRLPGEIPRDVVE